MIRKYIILILLLMTVHTVRFNVDANFEPNQTDDSIIYAMPYDYDEYSVYTANSYSTAQWNSAIYNGFLKRLPNGDWEPELAISTPRISSDGLTYTFDLRDDLLFSNGHRLTTEDVEFSFNAALTPLVNTNFYGMYPGYLNNESINVVDNKKVEFTFLKKHPFPYTFLNFPVTDKAVFDDRYDRCLDGIIEDCEWNDPNGYDAVGAGPFFVNDIDNTHEIITLDTNPFYYAANEVKTDRIIFQKIADKDAAVNALASGLIDILDSQYVPRIDELQDLEGVRDAFTDDPAVQLLTLNHLNPYFGTGEFTPNGDYDAAVSVRKAMSHIVNREFSVNEIMEGLAVAATTAMPKASIGWNEDLNPREYSLKIARDYMEAAGFDYADLGLTRNAVPDTWVANASNKFFELTVLSPNSVRGAQWSANYVLELPKIGIHVKEHVSTGWGELIPRTFRYGQGEEYDFRGSGNTQDFDTYPLPPSYDNGGFDIFFVGYGWGIDWDPTALYDADGRCDTGDCSNFINFDIEEENSDIAFMVDEYIAEMDFDAKIEIVKELQAEIYAHEPVIPILYPRNHWGYLEELIGIEFNLLSISEQDWSTVERWGFNENDKNTEVIPDDEFSYTLSRTGKKVNETTSSLSPFLTSTIPIGLVFLILITSYRTRWGNKNRQTRIE